MSHHHQHSSGCGCTEEDHQIVEGIQDYLYDKIDKDNVIVLNAQQPGHIVIKPWAKVMDEVDYVESEADEQLIFQIPFTGSIKLRSILIKSGPQQFTPDRVKIFSNQTLDFDEATSTDVTQEFEIVISREFVEYAVRPAKFPAVHSLTLFFPSNRGADTTRIYAIGFKGEFKLFTRDPVITIYELAANPADHVKIRGIDGGGASQIG